MGEALEMVCGAAGSDSGKYTDCFMQCFPGNAGCAGWIDRRTDFKHRKMGVLVPDGKNFPGFG